MEQTRTAELQRSRERTEDLRAGAARLAAIVQFSEDAIVAIDLQGIVTAWNPGAERLYNYTAEEMVGRSLAAVIPPERAGELADVIERVQRGEYIARYATVRMRKDGSRVDVSLTASPIKDAEGTVVGVSWAAHDITEERRLQKEREVLLADALRQAEARQQLIDRFNTLFRDALAMLKESTVQGLLRAVADGARRLGGATLSVSGYGHVTGSFRAGASSSARGEAICPPGQEFQVQRGGVYMDLIEGRESIRLSDEEMRRHPRWWGLPAEHGPLRGLLGARMVDRDGNPNGLILLTDKAQGDFTEEDETLLRQLAAIASLGLQHLQARDEAEAALAQSRRELQEIIDGAPFITFVRDLEGRFVTVSHPLEQLLGKGHEEILGRTDDDLFPKEWSGYYRAHDRQVVAENRPVEFEEVFSPAGGERHTFLADRFPLRDAGGRTYAVAGILFDIGERRRAEEERVRMMSELGAADAQSQQALAQLEAVTETMREGIQVMDGQGNVVRTNRAALDNFGYESPKEHPRRMYELLETFAFYDTAGRPLPAGMLPWARVARGETVVDQEVVQRRFDKTWTRVVSYSGAPVRDAEGRITMSVLISRDITDRKQA